MQTGAISHPVRKKGYRIADNADNVREAMSG